MSVEVIGDGKTVWVNGPDGGCLARFGRNGIDVHRPTAEQMKGNVCLNCTHAPVTVGDWEAFRESARVAYGVQVPEGLKPTYL